MKELTFSFVIHDFERGDFTLLFFMQVVGLECSDMSVASAAWLVNQPIIFVSFDQNKGSITNPVTQRGA